MQRLTRRAVGATLTIAMLGLLSAGAAAHERYEVEPGDTLTTVADRFDLPGGAVRAIVRDNAETIDDPDVIFAGTDLRIPVTPAGLDLDSFGAPAAEPGDSAAASQPAATTTSGGVWDRLAACESNGRWSLNVGTFDGGLQFHPDTWTAFGGDEYATYAYQATRSEQIAIAERVLDAQGWGAWPACSAALGLR